MSREEYLGSLRSFIESSSDAIKKFRAEMGWQEPLAGGKARAKSSSTEVVGDASDSQNINEYSDEPLLPSTSISLPSSANFTVTIDAERQRDLLLPYKRSAGPDTRRPPASAGELTANFAREERLAMYDYTLKNATGVAIPHEILPLETSNPEDSQPKELSGLELKKAMRDFKRRRQAYRTKVSTKNKSQTQVTRELIHNMMVYLGVEELEQETVPTQGDFTGMPKPVSNQHSTEEGKSHTPVPRHSHGKRDGREYNKHCDAKDLRDYEGGDHWNGRHTSEREYDTRSYRSQMENEKEYGPEVNRDKRKYNNKRKEGAEYHRANYKDKRFKCESRYNENEERSRGRKYDKYSENESKLRKSNEHSYQRLQEFDSLRCTVEKIKEEDSCDKLLEKRKGKKKEYNEDGEISSHESESSSSERDHKVRSSSKHRKKQKLKKKKMKRKHKKKRKHKRDHKDKRHQSESEESVNDRDDRYMTSKTDLRVKGKSSA